MGVKLLRRLLEAERAGLADTAESLLAQGTFDKVGETVQLIKAKKRLAGVGAHDLRVIVECEKAKLDVDFYQKTLHTLDYRSAPGPNETGALGTYDNSWCNDPDEVIDAYQGDAPSPEGQG